MGHTSRARELGDLLERLKQRSGRSYESIGRKINASKSAVHRYCTGAALPPEFGIVERIAAACGASREEVYELHRVWLEAKAPAPAAVRPRTPKESPQEPRATQTAAALLPPAGEVRARRAYVTAAAVVALSLSLALGGASTRSDLAALGGGRAYPSAGESPQWVPGPAWALPAVPVPRTLFGVTVQSATGTMPSFQVGAVRLWDSATRWSLLQPTRDRLDWTTLDRHVDGAQRAGLPVLYVFGGTPQWAGPRGAPGVYPDGSRASGPDDLGDWDAFVRALAGRYRGRIEAYELWALGNDPRFFDSPIEKLVEMTQRASRIIREVDPKATMVCPGMGRLWEGEGRDFLRRFAELGGYTHCDVASVKLYQPKASDPPETLLDLLPVIDRVMHEAGIHMRLWNTGTTYAIPLEKPLDAETARNHAVRFFLAGLFARNFSLDRMYFYAWGGTKIPIVLQADGGAPTAAALAVEQLQRWLAPAQSRSCGHGLAANLPEQVWQCDFGITGTDGTRSATIRWTTGRTAHVPAGPGAHIVQRLDGTYETVGPQDSIAVGPDPILIKRIT